MANSPRGESVLDRILAILGTFTNDRTTQSASEIGRRAGLPSSTAHRLVADLVAAGVLERDDDDRIRLGMRLWELAMRGSRALRLREAAWPSMEWLCAGLGQHVQLAVIEDDATLVLERLSPPRAGPNLARVAGRLPLHASSAGLVLLAHASDDVRERVLAGPLEATTPRTPTDPERVRALLARVREHGRIAVDGAIEPNSTSIAVPVRAAGVVVAALAVVMPIGALPEHVVADRLRSAATSIGRALEAQIVSR